MSQLYDAFFEALQDGFTVGGSSTASQEFILRDAGTSVKSKTVSFGPNAAQSPGGGGEPDFRVEFIGSTTSQPVTFKSVPSKFDELLVKTDIGSSGSLVQTVLFTFSQKDPNGNNVDVDVANVSFPNDHIGLWYMATESWSDPAHRVELEDSNGSLQGDTSDEAFTAEPTNDRLRSDDSPVRIGVSSSYTADRDQLQYDSSTSGSYEPVSKGNLNGNSFSVNPGDAIEISGTPAIKVNISV